MSEAARLVRQLRSELDRRRRGRRYQINLDAMDAVTLRELLRLLQDLDRDREAELTRARTLPWLGWFR